MNERGKEGQGDRQEGKVIRLPIIPTPEAQVEGLIREGTEEQKFFGVA
jgi:hypothetical protein